ncbi:MAG: DegV family protein [Oscillospiraceae bacterium]|nr:DegV family protein [Oscillospiraceae bacterium]
MGVRIIIDSTVNVKKELDGRFPVVPLTINFGSESYADNVEMDHNTFYKKLVESEVLPTTSQPTPDAFAKAFEEAVNAGDEVVVITISSRLSGTYQSANIAAADFEGKVFVVDSYTVTIGAGILVERAVKLADEGKSAAEIAAVLEKEKENIRVFAVVDTLEYLKKGGRVSAAVAFAGGLLNFKPVIAIADGVVQSITKGRGNKQANQLMNTEVEKSGTVDFEKPILIGYTGADDSLMHTYIADYADIWGGDAAKINTAQIGSVVGTHAGPGAVAVAYFVK